MTAGDGREGRDEGTRFESRRHRVVREDRDGIPVVRKTYADAEAARREREAYDVLTAHGIRVPAPLAWGPRDLVLPLVPGVTAADLLASQDARPPDAPRDIAPWRALAAWVADLHARTGLTLGDPNLRNFLYDDRTGDWTGVDFEDCAAGDPVDDVAELLAHVMLLDPPRTPWKEAVATAMRERYAERSGWSADEVRERQSDREAALAARRAARRAGG